MNFYTADPHLGHANIIKHCSRPFPDVHTMNRTIIDNINAMVGPQDTLWILGDFAFRNGDSLGKLRSLIKCRNVHLIIGNHEPSQIPNGVFSSVSHFQEVKSNGVLFTLCHYPMRSWNKSHHNSATELHSVQLYGHVHGRMIPLPYTATLDVGVDVHNFMPLSETQVLEKIKAQFTPAYETWYQSWEARRKTEAAKREEGV